MIYGGMPCASAANESKNTNIDRNTNTNTLKQADDNAVNDI